MLRVARHKAVAFSFSACPSFSSLFSVSEVAPEKVFQSFVHFIFRDFKAVRTFCMVAYLVSHC